MVQIVTLVGQSCHLLNMLWHQFFNFCAGQNKAVVRPYEPGYADNKVLVRRNYGFKIVVKKPTGEKDDQFYCDIYIDKQI